MVYVFRVKEMSSPGKGMGLLSLIYDSPPGFQAFVHRKQKGYTSDN